MPVRSDYYVYALFDAFGIPRYIGKGRGKRWLDHERKPDPKNRAKNAIIKRTMAALGEVPKVKLRTNLTEPEAFEIEVAFIAAIGRLDLRTGPLTNMSAGGTGGDFGESVRKTKSKWTPEKRTQAQETYRASTKAWWASLSPDERSYRLSKLHEAAAIARRLRQTSDPDYEKRRGEKVSQGHARRTPEEKAASTEKRLASFSPERQSEILKRFNASQTPEERSLRVKGKSTPEERSERARKSAASMTPEARSERARRQQANLTPEQKKEQSERAIRLGQGTRWINDGTTNKRLKLSEPLPTEWSYGRTRKPRKPRNRRRRKSRVDNRQYSLF